MLSHRWGFPLALLAAALLGAGGYAVAQRLTPAASRDKAAIEHVVRNYLLENPELLVEVSDRLRAKETAKANESAQKALASDRDAIHRVFPGAAAGNPNGDVTLVAFLDYNCGYCRASLPAIAELIRRDPGLKVVYREYPVLGPESVTAARWALAAAKQGKFKPFHEALYAAGRVTEASLNAAAAAAGMDAAAARTALDSKEVRTEIASNHRIGESLGMTGTPAWVVGDQVLSGAVGYDALAEAVATARKGK